MRFKIKYHLSIFEKCREHDLNAVEIYKECSEDSSFALVGHVPIELSRLAAGFLGTSKMHSVSGTENAKWVLSFLDFVEQE